MGKFGLFDDDKDNENGALKTPNNIKLPRVPSKSLDRVKDTWCVKPFPKSPSKVAAAPGPRSMKIEQVIVEPVKIIHKNKLLEDEVAKTLDLIARLEKDWFAEKEAEAEMRKDEINRKEEEQKIKAKAALKAKENQAKLMAEQEKAKTLSQPTTKPVIPTNLSKNSPLQILPATVESIPKPSQSLAPNLPVIPQNPLQSAQPLREVGSKSALETSSFILQKLEQTKTLKKSLPQQFQNQLLRDKMKINRTVGQLTNSQKKLVPLIKDLNQLFTSSQQQPEYYRILLYLCAKKIVKQAEMEISVKQESCFPIGILVVHLSNKHPEFNQILLGRMMKKCPYVVPCYPRKQADESKEAYQARVGYKMKGTCDVFIQFKQIFYITNPNKP